MATATPLQQRYGETTQRIAAAASRAGRQASDVVLVAVGKYADIEDLHELARLGHRDFGESRPQQLAQRAPMLHEWLHRTRQVQSASGVSPSVPDSLRWHMIGHVQRNKARKVADNARLVHSVDSLRLAEELHEIGMHREETLEGLLQVNCSGESSKGGIALPAALPIAEQLAEMSSFRLRGVMTMAPLEDPDGSAAQFTFERCREVFEDIKRRIDPDERFEIVSMGMSNDFEPAIEHGANMVRVGGAIFGPRAVGAASSA